MLTCIFKVQKVFALGCKYSRIILRSLSLLWEAAPGEIPLLVTALVIQGTTPALSVWITKQVVDTVVGALAQERELGIGVLGGLMAVWAGALLLGALLEPWVTATQGNIYEKLTAHLNILLMKKADKLPDLIRFEDSRFYDDLQYIQQQVARRPLDILTSLSFGGRGLFTVITMLGLLAQMSWWLPILVLIATLPQAYVSLRIQQKVVEMTVGKSLQSRRMQYCASVMLTDTYAKEVRLFPLGPFLINYYQKAFQEQHRAMRYLRGRQVLWSSSMAVLSTLGNAFAFFWVVQQSFQRLISPGNVLVLIQALSYIQQNFPMLIQTSTSLYETLLYMERLFRFLDSKPAMTLFYPSQPVPKLICSGITFDQVHFCYPDGRSALAGISFTLKPGETVAIVGDNGAGKTTIVKLLARLYDPTAGTIWIDGKNLKHIELGEWRRQIAVIFQDFGRYAFTLAENIALGDLQVLGDSERLERAVQSAGISKLVEQLPEKYQTPLGKQFGGTELSGGQWQKLALARAFVREEETQILILDEPTATLDPRSEYEVYRHFAELSQGKTTLLITHRLASVRMADRILVLKNGHLIEEGTHEKLLQDGGEYAMLWEMQAEKYRF